MGLLFNPFDFEEVGGAGHAGVVGADDDFGLVGEFFFGFVEVFVEVFFKVVFDIDLVLGGRDDDVVVGDYAFFVGGAHVVEDAPGSFDDADAEAGFGG